MIEGIILNIGGRDMSSRLSTYKVIRIIERQKFYKTMDGKKHFTRKVEHYRIEFTLMPFTDSDVTADYKAMSSEKFTVRFTNPYDGGRTSTYSMRTDCDIDATFGINSVNGFRYYKGEPIVLVQAGA